MRIINFDIFKTSNAFTLVELLVVTSILIVISTASIFGIINISRKASLVRAEKDLNDLQNSIEIARLNTGKRLKDITGSGCSECVCRLAGGTPIEDLRDQSSPCWVNYRNAIDKINQASNGLINGYPVDPWGQPYFIDENEWEWTYNPCRLDHIYSVGPNGEGSDLSIRIPFYYPCP